MSKKKKSPKRSGLYLWGNLLAMVVVVCLLVFLTFKGLEIYTRHGQDITVPSLKGMSYEKAKITLESLKLQCNVADSGYMPRLPANTVLDQSVKTGSKVKEGRVINVTINSATPPTIVMPDLADNSSLREAESRLLAIGFRLGPTEYVDGEREWVYGVKAGGRVVSAGTRISVDTPIVLVVGNGVTEEEMLFVDSTDYTDDFLTDENGEIVGADGVATEESSDTDEESTPTYNDGYTYPIQ